jgi:hypothetical protein
VLARHYLSDLKAWTLDCLPDPVLAGPERARLIRTDPKSIAGGRAPHCVNIA